MQQKHLGFRFPENWVHIPVLPFARCVNLDELFNSAEAKSPHLLNGLTLRTVMGRTSSNAYKTSTECALVILTLVFFLHRRR